MFQFRAGLAAGLVLAVATPAAAAPIQYSFSGLFTPAGAAEAIAAEITGLGNTADAFSATVEGQVAAIIPLSAISLTIGGQTAQLPGSALFFTLPDVGFAGFSPTDGNPDPDAALIAQSDGLKGYDGVSAIGPVNVSVLVAQLTIGGALMTFAAEGSSFRAAFVQAVPEPATWAMMIAGFGLAGVAMRRRHRADARAA